MFLGLFKRKKKEEAKKVTPAPVVKKAVVSNKSYGISEDIPEIVETVANTGLDIVDIYRHTSYVSDPPTAHSHSYDSGSSHSHSSYDSGSSSYDSGSSSCDSGGSCGGCD